MRKAALIALVPLALAIALLVLNLRESDLYEFGSAAPAGKGGVSADDFAFQRVFPDLKFIHACAGCGECVHPFEILENRRVMSIRDRDGWYKVFWSDDEQYFYGDPVHLLADWGNNRSADPPRGRWTIRLRAGASTHRTAPAHDCGQIPREIALAYDLAPSADPLDETFHSGDGPMKILQTFSWITAGPGKPLSLGWKLVGAPQVQADPCPCAKP